MRGLRENENESENEMKKIRGARERNFQSFKKIKL